MALSPYSPAPQPPGLLGAMGSRVMSLLGLDQADQPDQFQTLVGNYYNPRQAALRWIGGSLEGLGEGLATGKPGAWAEGALHGGRDAIDQYRQQALLGYELGQRADNQAYQRSRDTIGDQHWQAEQDRGAKQFDMGYDLQKAQLGMSEAQFAHQQQQWAGLRHVVENAPPEERPYAESDPVAYAQWKLSMMGLGVRAGMYDGLAPSPTSSGYSAGASPVSFGSGAPPVGAPPPSSAGMPPPSNPAPIPAPASQGMLPGNYPGYVDPATIPVPEAVKRAAAYANNPKIITDWQTSAAQQQSQAYQNTPENLLRKGLADKETATWNGYQTAATTAAGRTQDLQVLDELLKTAPQGPLTGRLAEMFPGFSSAGDAAQAIVSRVAPTMRTPGSGSQSDIEFEGFLKSFPRLRGTPQGNAIISHVLQSKNAIDMQRGAIVDQFANGQISAATARAKIAEINKQSILTDNVKALISGGTKSPAEMSNDELLKALNGGTQ